jgi:hypothetical protein
MELNFKVGNIAASVCLAALSGMVHAGASAANLALPTAASFYTNNFQLLKSGSFNSQALNSPAYLLAANEVDAAKGMSGANSARNAPATPAAQFKPPWMSGRKAHEYLGLGTVALAGLTMLAAPGEKESTSQSQPRQTSGTTHTRLARATAAMAVATVITGLLYHWDDVHIGDGWKDPDNQHVMLAGAGALLMLYAVEKSAHSTVPTSHAAFAEAGAAAMVVAIKLTW